MDSDSEARFMVKIKYQLLKKHSMLSRAGERHVLRLKPPHQTLMYSWDHDAAAASATSMRL
jgi:hypothetical protein